MSEPIEGLIVDFDLVLKGSDIVLTIKCRDAYAAAVAFDDFNTKFEAGNLTMSLGRDNDRPASDKPVGT